MKLLYFFAGKILEWKKPAGIEEIRKKQMLMNPGKSGKELVETYYIKKISIVMLFLICGLIISAAAGFADSGAHNFIAGNTVKRNGYGEGDRLIKLDVFADDEEVQKETAVTISERQYTAEEIDGIFDEIGEKLKSVIMNGNTSQDHIDKDLDLVTEMDEYPVSIEWRVSDYSVLDGRGKIRDDYTEKNGRIVKLTASLSYMTFAGEYEFNVKVFPKKLSETEQFRKDIIALINEYGIKTASKEQQQLPEKIDGKQLSYRTSVTQTWVYVMLIAGIAALCLYFGKDRELTKAVKKREKEMLMAYPEMVSKLTLLLGAGMTIRAAFEKVAYDHQKKNNGKKLFAYEEMSITVNRMKSGISEYEAYMEFGKRCAVRRYTKLGALLSQNLKKGSQGLLQVMEEEVKDAFEDRKASAKRLGEEAGTKLLAPMAMMLMVVMIVVIVPAFMSFGI